MRDLTWHQGASPHSQEPSLCIVQPRFLWLVDQASSQGSDLGKREGSLAALPRHHVHPQHCGSSVHGSITQTLHGQGEGVADIYQLYWNNSTQMIVSFFMSIYVKVKDLHTCLPLVQCSPSCLDSFVFTLSHLVLSRPLLMDLFILDCPGIPIYVFIRQLHKIY